MFHIRRIHYLLPFVMVVISFCFFFGIANGITINTTTEALHTPRLFSLYLGTGNDIGINVIDDKLTVSSGIVVGYGSSNSNSAASIGGGDGNTIGDNSNNAGIAGGQGNGIDLGTNSIIGGGKSNNIQGGNAVIAGGESNRGNQLGNIMGGQSNAASDNGVVLGGINNTAGDNSLVLGAGAKGLGRSFAWNGEAATNSALIRAANGILIGTNQSITGVNLVVNGAIKLGGSNSQTGVAGEIKVVDGCFYAYDGLAWHIINRNTTGSCTALTVSQVCEFGNIQLQEGDVVTGYNVKLAPGCPRAGACGCHAQQVTCSGGLLRDASGDTGYSNPYCYEY